MAGLKEKAQAAIERSGYMTPSTFAAAKPGEHCWFEDERWHVCAVCGIVKSMDRDNGPCKGPARITTR